MSQKKSRLFGLLNDSVIIFSKPDKVYDIYDSRDYSFFCFLFCLKPFHKK